MGYRQTATTSFLKKKRRNTQQSNGGSGWKGVFEGVVDVAKRRDRPRVDEGETGGLLFTYHLDGKVDIQHSPKRKNNDNYSTISKGIIYQIKISNVTSA